MCPDFCDVLLTWFSEEGWCHLISNRQKCSEMAESKISRHRNYNLFTFCMHLLLSRWILKITPPPPGWTCVFMNIVQKRSRVSDFQIHILSSRPCSCSGAAERPNRVPEPRISETLAGDDEKQSATLPGERYGLFVMGVGMQNNFCCVNNQDLFTSSWRCSTKLFSF